MGRNIELKARVRDPGRFNMLAALASDTPPEMLAQEDVFYDVPSGRLKLRILAPHEGQLIAYSRDDAPGPRACVYEIFETADPALLDAVLRQALPVRAVVRKKRLLYLAGRARIHFDRVEGLGDFMEIEVVLADGEDEAGGRRVAEDLLARLEIPPEDLVDRAYVDLLQDR